MKKLFPKNISVVFLLALSFFALSMSLTSCGGGGGGGGSCGGAGGTPCGAGQFCHFTDLSCGAGEATGSCESIPTVCDSNITNVCSCENLSFFNECFANAASQSVKAPGNCP